MSELDLIKQITKLQRQVDGLIKPEVGRWVDWTPTVTQGVAVTVTIGYAKYVVIDNAVFMRVALNITSAGTAGSVIQVGGVPTAVQPGFIGSDIGEGRVFDAGTAHYVGALVAVGASDFRIMAHAQGNYIGAAPSFALASGDAIYFTAFYERA